MSLTLLISRRRKAGCIWPLSLICSHAKSWAGVMNAQLVCNALTMAVWQRKPKAGLIHHSDRGSQYTRRQFRRLLTRYKVTGSVSRKGDCWDNGVPRRHVAESLSHCHAA